MKRSNAIELGLTIPLLKQIVNAKPSRCVGAEGLGMAAERLTDILSRI